MNDIDQRYNDINCSIVQTQSIVYKNKEMYSYHNPNTNA